MSVTSTLTDGSGVSQLLGSKIVKDLVLDFVMTAAASLAAVNIAGVDAAVAQSAIVVTAVADAAIRVGFRFVVRWAQS